MISDNIDATWKKIADSELKSNSVDPMDLIKKNMDCQSAQNLTDQIDLEMKERDLIFTEDDLKFEN